MQEAGTALEQGGASVTWRVWTNRPSALIPYSLNPLTKAYQETRLAQSFWVNARRRQELAHGTGENG